MKILRTSLLFLFLLAVSCDSNDTGAVIDRLQDEVVADENENQDNTDDEISLSLVAAFQQLSFEQPLDLQAPNDSSNRIFVVEKKGKIKVFSNEVNVATSATFLDLSNTLSSVSEQGLLGLAFHPNYDSNGFFYVCYNSSENLSVISRFTVSATDTNIADASSELILLEISQPFTNHNGGQIAFGPEGYLYIALGDGGSGGDPLNHGQNTTSLLGSIIRIDVDANNSGLNYGIPLDNPFVANNDIRDEIYAYGFRNPWRLSFDSQTGNLWTGDVGQGKIEEIDIVTSGGNYGWKFFEGTDCFSGDCNSSGLIPPLFEYNHDNGDLSITGGYVYRGSVITALQGKYIYGDFASGRIWALEENGTTNELLFESGLAIASFGTDANNELYVCAFDGKIYKFEEN